MNNYERLKIAYELSDEMLNKYKSNVKIIEINKKIKKGKIKTLRQLYEALNIPWIAFDQYGREIKDKILPKDYQISLFVY